MMRKVFLMLFVLMSFTAFSQLKVKEGSFKKVENCVILDKRYDDNNNPMALIRIYTENILPEQKRDFFFDSDFGTNLEPSIAESGEIELYATYTVKKIKLTHNFFSPLDIVIPFDLEGNACYELILQGPGQQPTPTPTQQKKYHLIVKADQADATIYIDGTAMNFGEASKLVDEGTTHTYKIECDMYHAETGSVTVNEKTVINKTLRPAFGYINISTSPEQGAKVSVDGKYIGVSPITTDKLASGTHTVRVMKEMYKMKEQSFTVNDGQTTNANITMTANFVNVTVNTDSQSDIYVDEEYKGKGRWTGRISEGSHIFEARKANHKASKKTIDLVLGKNETITLEAPKPINGSIEINSSPMEANIYIDGKNYGTTPNYINEIIIGTHELKLEKQGCTTITKSITIKEGETLSVNEKLVSQQTTDNRQQASGNASQDISGTINGHEYVDLGLSVKWATCNVGASKPEDYGNYYAWGETSTKSSYTSDNSKTFGKQMNDIKGNSQYDAARANWGSTWRLPTKAELEELENKCTWTWTTQNGVKGYKVTGPNGNSIFLPAAGSRYGSSPNNAGERGYYWSSAPFESNSDYAYSLCFHSGFQYVNWLNRYSVLSVRPVLDEEDIYIVSVNNETFTVNGVSFTMIAVKGGTFNMGAQSTDPSGTNYDSDAASDEKPVHSVTLSDYYIGETEVTQELWEAVMGSNPSDFKGSQNPVEKVSWHDCKEFITKLNRLTGRNFRLPTEAEWEYAARGGNKSKGYKYSGSNTIGNVAWYWDNSSYTTHNVKTKSPNELGIYDMSGNVLEWCEDWYGNYSSGSQTNPTGPSSDSYRVYRGGCWGNYARNCRVSSRNGTYSVFRDDCRGLRLCLSQY